MTERLALLLVEVATKGSLLLVVAGLCNLALGGRSAAQRHLAWTVAVAAMLLLVPLSLWFPAHALDLPERLAPALEALLAPSGQRADAAHSPAAEGLARLSSEILVAAVALILFVSWALLRTRYRGMARADDPRIVEHAKAAARRLGVAENGFRVYASDRAPSPMTWGMLRPVVVVLPAACAGWDDERLDQALIHELVHVRRRDAAAQALCNAACALYWFNPLVWWAARRMVAEREGACDDVLLESGARPSAYAHELLGIARSLGRRWTGAPVAPSMVRRSQIGVRLLAILDSGQRRYGLGRTSKAVAGAAGLAVTLLLASVTLAHADRTRARGGPVRFTVCRTRHLSGVVLSVEGGCDCGSCQVALGQIRRYLEQAGVSEFGPAYLRRTDFPGRAGNVERVEVGYFVAPGALQVRAPFESRDFPAALAAWADLPADGGEPWPRMIRWTLDHGYMPRGNGFTVMTGGGRKGLLLTCYKWPER
jgi:beta-lactamase regulating signal transducer with metallopeptidase domain